LLLRKGAFASEINDLFLFVFAVRTKVDAGMYEFVNCENTSSGREKKGPNVPSDKGMHRVKNIEFGQEKKKRGITKLENHNPIAFRSSQFCATRFPHESYVIYCCELGTKD
jgi:hypothetical protein